ncbi:MAG TPA: CarD family transcriptional regulator, partial [Enhygromyxa sp.]|nr:CarD family transcriptional regulator [Enhygromyxa sp.]
AARIVTGRPLRWPSPRGARLDTLPASGLILSHFPPPRRACDSQLRRYLSRAGSSHEAASGQIQTTTRGPTTRAEDTMIDTENFEVGSTAVYPAHGVADVVGLETKHVAGQALRFYHLQVRGSGLKIIVPIDKAGENGMRPLAGPDEIDKMFEILRDHDVPTDRQTWNRRYRNFMEKIRTGSLHEVAEVYRDLSLLRSQKTLSHGEREMLRTARDLLVGELAVARETSESEVAEQLDSLFKN